MATTFFFFVPWLWKKKKTMKNDVFDSVRLRGVQFNLHRVRRLYAVFVRTSKMLLVVLLRTQK